VRLNNRLEVVVATRRRLVRGLLTRPTSRFASSRELAAQLSVAASAATQLRIGVVW
jgi:hypothetical protein